MPFADTQCAVKLSDAAKGVISSADLKQIFDNVDARKGQDSFQKIAAEAAGTFLSQKRFEAIKAKRNAIFNLAAQKKIMSDADLLHKSGMSYAKAFQAQPAGEFAHLGSGSRLNAETQRAAIVIREQGRLTGDLKKAGVMKAAKTTSLDGHVNTAMRSLAPKATGIGHVDMKALDALHPSLRAQVMKVAQLRVESATRMHEQMTAAGLIVSKRGIYTGHVTHDTAKIRTAGAGFKDRLFNKSNESSHDYFVRKLEKTIDIEGTRKNLVALGRMGQLETLSKTQFFNRLADIFQGAPRKEPRGEGVEYSGSVASVVEKAHILEFKDGNAQAEYNQEFGSGSGISSHLHMIEGDAHAISSMNSFGPMAQDNLASAYKQKLLDLGQQKEDLRNSGAPASKIDAIQKEIDAMNEGQSKLDDYMNGYLRVNKDPGNMTVATISENIRAVTRMALLGKAVIAQLPTMITGPTLLHMGGVPLLRSYFHVWLGMLERMGSAKQDYLRQNGAGIEGILGNLSNNLTEAMGGNKPGQIIKNLETYFYKGTGFTLFRDSTASGIVYGLSNDIAHDAGKAWDELAPGRQKLLADYKISPAEWDIIRQHAMTEANGTALVGTDKIGSVPLEKFSGLDGARTNFALTRASTALELKMATLFHDSANIGTVTPDLKTHMSTPFVNAKPGTFQGELGKFTMQFSTWGWAHAMMALNRYGRSMSFTQFMGSFLGPLTMMGMAGFTIKQLLAGRNPLQNPDLWKTDDPMKSATAWSKFVGTGALTAGVSGMLGDTLLSQSLYNGRGDSGTQIGGPIKDDISQLGHFGYDALFNGKVDGSQMLKFAQGSTPFINSWWIKPMLDYMVMYGLEEHLNPGSLERMERQSAKNGLPYYAPPSQDAVQF